MRLTFILLGLLCCVLNKTIAQVDPEILTHIHKIDEAKYKQDIANVLSYKAGARIVASSTWSRESPWPSQNTINDSLGTDGLWIASLKHRPNHWIVVELPEERMISTFCFNTASFDNSKVEGVAPQSVMIEFSTDKPDDGYKEVASEMLRRNLDEQFFHVEYQKVRWIKITIDSNYGNDTYMGLGRVYAYDDFEMNHYENELLANGKLDIRVHFHHNSAILNAESIPIIEEIAMVLNNNPSFNIRVEGHTDSTGGEHYNLKLSKSRAKTVVDLLVDMGISASRLSYVGKGESELLKHVSDDKHKYKNRRVSFVLL